MGVKVTSYSPAVLYPTDFAHPEEMEIEVISDYSGNVINDKYVWVCKEGIYTKEEALATLTTTNVTIDGEPYIKYSLQGYNDYFVEEAYKDEDIEEVLEWFDYDKVDVDDLEPDDPEEPDTDFLFEQERDARYEEECK